MAIDVWVFFEGDELVVVPETITAGKGSAPTIQWKTLQAQPRARIDEINIHDWPYDEPRPPGSAKVKTVVDLNLVAQNYKYDVTASLGSLTATLDPTIRNEGQVNGVDPRPPKKPHPKP